MATPLLSIVIPVYNVEAYLRQCLDSVLKSDGAQDCEVILVNDGSTDSSPEICREYASHYSNVRLVNQPNQGLSEARNTGIRHATGKYILFLDSDDFLYEGSLKYILSNIERSTTDIFLGRAYKYYQDTDTYRLSQKDYVPLAGKKPAEAFLTLISGNDFWFAAWLVIIEREFLLSHNLFFMKGIYHEDELWVPSVFMTAATIGFMNKGFYCYRLNRAGSIVSKPNIKLLFDKLIVGEKLEEFASRSNICAEIVHTRQASLELGCIYNARPYVLNPRYDELCRNIRLHVEWLTYGKYSWIRILIKVLGIRGVIKMLSLFRK
ncbi:MAG: glycosyltransferase [Muribaculaceae bacterium]|nr:glycosyltransferase [Muribaculaceae bacterium]